MLPSVLVVFVVLVYRLCVSLIRYNILMFVIKRYHREYLHATTGSPETPLSVGRSILFPASMKRRAVVSDLRETGKI